ncbi:hypothetical protein KM043_005754 [Ampulex compressa]|nr:hypothetical protein KM043_005754 [Ampulex compressa]
MITAKKHNSNPPTPQTPSLSYNKQQSTPPYITPETSLKHQQNQPSNTSSYSSKPLSYQSKEYQHQPQEPPASLQSKPKGRATEARRRGRRSRKEQEGLEERKAEKDGGTEAAAAPWTYDYVGGYRDMEAGEAAGGVGRARSRNRGGGGRLGRGGRGGGGCTLLYGKPPKCALRVAHLSLPNAHRPLPARSTNWANRWTPTDLRELTFVVAHASSDTFRLPPGPCLYRGRHRFILKSDVVVGCRVRSRITDWPGYSRWPWLSVDARRHWSLERPGKLRVDRSASMIARALRCVRIDDVALRTFFLYAVEEFGDGAVGWVVGVGWILWDIEEIVDGSVFYDARGLMMLL